MKRRRSSTIPQSDEVARIVSELSSLNTEYRKEIGDNEKTNTLRKLIKASESDYNFKVLNKERDSRSFDTLIGKKSAVSYPGRRKKMNISSVDDTRPGTVHFPGESTGKLRTTRIEHSKTPFVRDWLCSKNNQFSDSEIDSQQRDYEALMPLQDTENLSSASHQLQINDENSKAENEGSSASLEELKNDSLSTNSKNKIKIAKAQDSLKNESRPESEDKDKKIEYSVSRKQSGKENQTVTTHTIKRFFDNINNQQIKHDKSEGNNAVGWKSVKRMNKDLNRTAKASSKLNISTKIHKKIEDVMANKASELQDGQTKSTVTQYTIHEISESQEETSGNNFNAIEKDRLACEEALRASRLDQPSSIRRSVDDRINKNLPRNDNILKVAHVAKQSVVPFLHLGKCAPYTKKVKKRIITINLNVGGNSNVNLYCPKINIPNFKQTDENSKREVKDVALQADFSDIVTRVEYATKKNTQADNNKNDVEILPKVVKGFSQEVDMFEVDEIENQKQGEENTNNIKLLPSVQAVGHNSKSSSEDTAKRTTQTLQQASSASEIKEIEDDEKTTPKSYKFRARSNIRQDSDNLFSATEHAVLTPKLVEADNPAIVPTQYLDDGATQYRQTRSRSALARTPTLRNNKVGNDDNSEDNSVSDTPQKQILKVSRISQRRSTILKDSALDVEMPDSQPKKCITPVVNVDDAKSVDLGTKIQLETPTEMKQFSEQIQHKSTPIETAARKSLIFSRAGSSPNKTGSVKSQASISSRTGPVVITMSNLTGPEMAEVVNAANLLHWRLTLTYAQDVTHLVIRTMENRAIRTLKYLQALADKKWIVSIDWIKSCLREEKHVNEEPFEALDDNGCPGPQKARLSKESLLADMWFYCLQPMRVSNEDLKIILAASGGTVVDKLKQVCLVGNPFVCVVLADPSSSQVDYSALAEVEKVMPISIEWLFNSLGTQEIQSFRDHLLCAESSLPKNCVALSQTCE